MQFRNDERRPFLTERLRIVQIVDNLEMGGLERMAIDLAIAHRAAGHLCSIYTAWEPGVLAAQAEAAGVPVVPCRRDPGNSLKFLGAMVRRLSRDKVNVVHTHNPGIHIYSAVAARLAGVPAVVNTRHGPINSLGHPYCESHFRMAMPFTNAVVFVSDHCRRALAPLGHIPDSKSYIIINGIQAVPFLNHFAAPGSCRPRIRFGAVGRLYPVKGHSVLLEAFALLVRRIPQAELRIIGGGPLFDELSSQATRLGLAHKICIEGPSSRIPEVLSELDVLVFSSLSEGLPLTILEAMAAGLPIVSTRVGGIPEVAPEGEVAWFCPPGEPGPLAAAMYQASVCSHLPEMGARAREIAIANYSVQTMQCRYESLYRRVLER